MCRASSGRCNQPCGIICTLYVSCIYRDIPDRTGWFFLPCMPREFTAVARPPARPHDDVEWFDPSEDETSGPAGDWLTGDVPNIPGGRSRRAASIIFAMIGWAGEALGRGRRSRKLAAECGGWTSRVHSLLMDEYAAPEMRRKGLLPSPHHHQNIYNTPRPSIGIFPPLYPTFRFSVPTQAARRRARLSAPIPHRPRAYPAFTFTFAPSPSPPLLCWHFAPAPSRFPALARAAGSPSPHAYATTPWS